WQVGLVPVTSPPVRVSQQAVVEASPSVSAKLPTRSRSTGPARQPEGPHLGPSGFIYDPTHEGRRGSLHQPTTYGAAVGEGWLNSGSCQDKSKRLNPASPKESCSSEGPEYPQRSQHQDHWYDYDSKGGWWQDRSGEWRQWKQKDYEWSSWDYSYQKEKISKVISNAAWSDLVLGKNKHWDGSTDHSDSMALSEFRRKLTTSPDYEYQSECYKYFYLRNNLSESLRRLLDTFEDDGAVKKGDYNNYYEVDSQYWTDLIAQAWDYLKH
ncbi:hypothetical protein FOZ63_016990, partial [Perkinsus olseni]